MSKMEEDAGPGLGQPEPTFPQMLQSVDGDDGLPSLPTDSAALRPAKGHLDLGVGLMAKLKLQAMRAKRRRRVFTRRLGSSELSNDEERPEFVNLDYTPVVIRRPIDMSFPIRVRRLQKDIELFICVTVHKQDGTALRDTLRGIGDNIRDLQIRLGLDWDEMAVAIVVDGRADAPASLLEFCSEDLHLYDPGMLQLEFGGQEVVMHLFEKSVQLPKHKEQREYHEPMQMILAIKEKAQGKVNSHLWFFTAFCRQLQPTYTVLFDAGVVPKTKALFHMVRHMENHEHVGAVCGQLCVRSLQLYNLWSSAQHVEQKLTDIFEKCKILTLPIAIIVVEILTPMFYSSAMESFFGFVSEPPSSFSAYRWVAIRGRPLNYYFYVEENSVKEMGPLVANAFLSEDRILAYELVTKLKRRWSVEFVPEAIAHGPAQSNLVGMLKDKRRVVNGTLFSQLRYLGSCCRNTFRSSHSACAIMGFFLLYCYRLLGLICSWLSVGTMFLLTHFMAAATFENLVIGSGLSYTFTMVYAGLVIAQVLSGLGSRPEDTALIYRTTAILYGVLVVGLCGFFIALFVSEKLPVELLYFVLAVFGGHFLLTILFGEIFQLIKALPQYIFAIPTLVNMVPVFSYCNANDISRDNDQRLAFRLGFYKSHVDSARAADQRDRQRRIRRGSLTEPLQLKPADSTVAKIIKTVNPPDQGPRRRSKKSTSSIDLTQVPRDILYVLHKAREGEAEEAHREIVDMLAAETARAKAEEKSLARSMREIQRTFAAFRTRLISMWLAVNWLYITFFIYFGLRYIFAWMVIGIVAFYSGFRILGASCFLCLRCFRCMRRCCLRTLCRCCRNKQDEEVRAGLDDEANLEFVEEFDEDGNLVARYPRVIKPEGDNERAKKRCCCRCGKSKAEEKAVWARHEEEGWDKQDAALDPSYTRRRSADGSLVRGRNRRASLSGTDVQWLDHIRAEAEERKSGAPHVVPREEEEEEDDDDVMDSADEDVVVAESTARKPTNSPESGEGGHYSSSRDDMEDEEEEDAMEASEDMYAIPLEDLIPHVGGDDLKEDSDRKPEEAKEREVRVSGINLDAEELRSPRMSRPGRTTYNVHSRGSVGEPTEEETRNRIAEESDAVARILQGVE